MAKPTPDQKVIALVVSQTMHTISDSKDVDSSDFYKYLQSELHTLDEILTDKERLILEDRISEIYLLIKEHKD
jgi:hypothetical protein